MTGVFHVDSLPIQNMGIDTTRPGNKMTVVGNSSNFYVLRTENTGVMDA